MTRITIEFARMDDCLDRLVPSDLRILVSERDHLLQRVAELEQHDRECAVYTATKEAELEQMIKNNLELLEQNRVCANAGNAVLALRIADLQRQNSSLSALLVEKGEDVEALKDWRRLALQFDGHRMQAMSMLKLVASGNFDIEEVKKFVAAAPISGDTHLREIRAESFAAGYHYGLTCHELDHPAKNIEDVISQYLDNIGGTKYTANTEKSKLKTLQCSECRNTLNESDMVGLWHNVCPICDSTNTCTTLKTSCDEVN